ncbi:autotransporter domain-containing protein [Ancylobacter sp. TS-1]|uniref:autotransporter domain-containing protein n=1 Tax=Ancylobacter sp. TS-1 TaxID=1850374 RepID=UPI001265C6B5|nr:autotransporter domain-containing protein [Ancylobacter sp. TS-1]QFR34477.1 autotransporter domain-containing protein [Ancylobacter sp. TS-1]
MSPLVLCMLAGTLVASPAGAETFGGYGGNGGVVSAAPALGGAYGMDGEDGSESSDEGVPNYNGGGGGGAGTLVGGAGGEGADAPDDGGFRRGGGDGGDGGHAGSVQSTDATLDPGVAGIYGTDGGDGANASSGFISGSQVGASGGGGGGGGYGIYGEGSIGLTLSGSGVVSGGKGGKGGQAGLGGEWGRGGDGGDGGIGVYFDSASVLDNQVTIIGGKGGDGADGIYGSDGAAGGAGVYGLSGLTLNNSGTITGAGGGKGGEGRFGDGTVGAGGVGVFGADMDITTSGGISGGLFGDGETRAAAILFVSGANSLTLQEGWSLTGDLGVNNFGSSLTFKLDGIDADVSNTITGQGRVIVDVGPQVLTLSGVNTYKGGTTISSGTLSVASEEALGDGVHLNIGAPVSGVTGLSEAASSLSSAISTYASAPTAENAAALAAAQASYRQAISEGQASGEMPTLQITGSVSLDPATDSAIAIAGGKAGAIRLEGADAGLTMQGFTSSMSGSAIMVNSDSVLDLGSGEGQTQGYLFSGNSASGAGVLQNLAGTVSIAGATFSNNQAAISGGAIQNRGVVTLSDSTFRGNSGYFGGAISQDGTLLVERSSFMGNDAQLNGGAIYVAGGSTTFIASSFSDNSAGDRGGAIFVDGSSGAVVVSIVDSDFTGNSARSAGGAIAMQGGTLNLMVSDGSSSLFSGNTLGGQASAIYVGTEGGTASALNVGTGTGALLDMRDPMSGSASNLTNTVAKTGAGTWALGGANVFAVSGTGATDFSVSEGRLYLYAAGEVDNPTTLDEDAVVGAGTLQLDGATSSFTVGADGTLVAGGANSVTTDGSISFEDGATLRGGNADTAMGGADPTFMEKGGATSLTLAATGGITLEGTLNVAALGAADSFTLNGALGGEDGALAKSGAGTVILTSASTFAAGTTISAGTLALSGSGALAATGALTLYGATSVFDISDADGARSIGTLSGVAGSSIVLGDNDLTFGGSIDTTFAGSFAGTGGLTKAGAGAVAFSGNSAAFTGTTSVTAGHLAVNGTLGGTVEVGTGASLGGTGSIGGLKVGAGGTLGPGNSIGTLTVAGNAVFETGSTFAVEVDAVSADRVSATGSATIEAGAAIDVELDGAYRLGARYTLISSSGLTGRFETVTGDVGAVSAFFTADLVYDAAAGALYLDVAQARSFADAARTPNQFRTANALNSLPVGNPLFQAVALLPDEASAQAAFTALSGDVNATVRGLFVENSTFTRRAMIDRLRAAQGAVGASTAPVMSYAPTGAPAGSAGAAIEAMTLKAAPATTSGPVLWGQGYGAWTDLDGSTNAAGLTSDTGGFLIGLDTALSSGWRLGVMGGYGYTSFDSGGRDASGSSDDWMVGAYAGRQWGALALRTGLAYVWQDVSSSRTVSLPDLAETLKADYTAGTFQAFGELGYSVETGFAVLEPFANLAYVSLHTGGFSETGGSAALTVASENTDTAFSTLGVRLAREIAFGSLEATLRGTLGWRHAFGDVTPELTQSYFGSAPFTVTGVPIAEDAALVEAGFDLAMSPAATLGIAYAGQFGDGTTQNGLNATIKVAF